LTSIIIIITTLKENWTSKLPNWERLWDDFTQEELRVGSSHASQPKGEEEENLALAGKGKSRAKKGSSWGQTSKGEKKKDLSKVKCFACHKPGHYASQCPTKKKGNKKSQMAASASTEVDDFAARFENEFSLIACLSSSTSTGVWYIDSGASSHMTGVHDYFSSLKEEELDLYIEMGTMPSVKQQAMGQSHFRGSLGSH
jgi:hypothetical protein